MAVSVLGIIGGGQLGCMLADAAKKLKVKTIILSDDIESPAKNFADEFIYSNYNNSKKINNFLHKVDLVTYEFENIPFETLDKISRLKKVLPEPNINKILQNRFTEKKFLNSLNILTTPYILIKSKQDLKSNFNLIPGLLKTCTLGYDGKGQHKISSIEIIDKINLNFENEYILEKIVDLKKEISVIITRFGREKYEIYEPIENLHEDQILKISKIPAEISKEIFDKSKEWSKQITDKLNYIGTLCVEFFIDKNEKLYVNEIAPRVHNSGHLTINSHNISQFENHIRAICGFQKIETKKICNAKMINIIGDEIIIYRNKKFSKKEFFFDYLKKNIKEKRKMGHLTTIEE
tara:strand:- start:11437 stop:12483 length:1047 start_codon:yes stop_codon:yes gene_type:complete